MSIALGGAPRARSRLGTRIARHWRLILPVALFLALATTYALINPRGLSVVTVTPWVNQGVALAFLAVGQFLAVVTGGLDLSIGGIMALTNAIASELVDGTPLEVTLGILAVLATGVACGLVNAAVIVYGRVAPIMATMATGAIYAGFALMVRPIPGGSVSEGLADALTYETFGVVPTALLLLFGIVYAVWWPLSRTVLGRSLYAIGSNEASAYMSGLSGSRARLLAYGLSGFFAACGGLFLGLQTLSGDASVGLSYTLNSLAAVVIGGASLAGGIGTVFGAIMGAYVLRTISAIMIFTALPALAQPLFEGTVLLIAVAIGALEFVGVKNRLKVMR